MYGNIQFHHNQIAGITHAVLIDFQKEDILESVHHIGAALQFQVGTSYVHPNDRYCKKTGRDVSKDRLAPVEVKLQSLNTNDDSTQLVFKNADLVIVLRVSKNSDKPHLIYVS